METLSALDMAERFCICRVCGDPIALVDVRGKKKGQWVHAEKAPDSPHGAVPCIPCDRL